jgi:Xaa-Pro aminopeptidase
LPAGKLIVYPDSLAGKSSAEKRHQVAAWLCTKQADAVVLSALDSIAWVLNVRGQDVDHTPVALAYAVVHRDGSTDLFVSRDKLTDAVIAHLGDVVRHHSREAFESYLGTLAGKRVAVDPDRTVAAVFQALESAGALAIEVRDPVVLPKAIKNALEIAGHKAAQLRDCAALCRFLAWLAAEAPSGALTELSAAARLREFREATGALRDLSFDTISSFGPNGAIVHYHPTEATCRQLRAGSLYLLDSGGQYIDGTTDVTRTISIGTPSQEMRQCFTRVLKGHIALARAVFPAGTNGGQLDVLARQHLWSAGLDYPHGTGHGVGAYLGVHEGPQRISRTGDCSEPLVPGMIVSIEPGYYKPGHYGIRIENLALIVECDVTGAEQPMLGFEALTFAPFDRALIDLTLLTMDERAWINTYHHNVARIVAPQLEGAAKEWLSDATRLLD